MTENVPAVVMMGAEEARAETDGAKADLVRGLGRLANVRDREGWKALDYDSWDAFCVTELGWTRNYANRQIDYEQFKGEVEAAAGAPVPGLTEGNSRAARKQREVTLAKVKKRTAGLPAEAAAEEARAVLAEAIPVPLPAPVPIGTTPEPEQKRTATHRSRTFEVSIVDPELAALADLAVAESVSSETEIVRFAQVVLDTKRLPWLRVIAAGDGCDVVDVVRRILDSVRETGEVPTFPVKANGQRRQREEPAVTNGADHRHVAGKPKASGLIFCEECGIPKIGDKWKDENGAAPSPARAVAAREARRAAERFVEPRFKK